MHDVTRIQIIALKSISVKHQQINMHLTFNEMHISSLNFKNY